MKLIPEQVINLRREINEARNNISEYKAAPELKPRHAARLKVQAPFLSRPVVTVYFNIIVG